MNDETKFHTEEFFDEVLIPVPPLEADSPREESPVREEIPVQEELSAQEEISVEEDDFSTDEGETGDEKTRLFDSFEDGEGDGNSKTRVAADPFSEGGEVGMTIPDGADEAEAEEKMIRRRRRRKVLSVLGKTGKYTGKTVLFVARKFVTYSLTLLLTVLLVGMIVGAVVGVAFMVYLQEFVDSDCPELQTLKYDSSQTTALYYTDRDGNLIELEEDRLSSSENRMWVAYDEIPQMLIDAYTAIEDQRFWEHNGVDTKRTLSAVYNFFVPSGSQYGGSTITQQLIKNVTGDNQNTMQRKIQEIFRALNVESKYDKTEIMEMYLNTIFLSENCYGVRAAAVEYFGKELSELTLNECAALASIGKSPVQYDPLINPQDNLERRNLVLREMLRQEKITQEQFDEAYDTPLQLVEDSETYVYTETVHSYYIDAVIDDVIADLMETYGYDERQASIQLYSGGLQIVTCMDPNVQHILETIYTDESYWPSTTGIQAQSAMCIMDAKTGNLLGIVGGRGEKKVSRGLNRATHSKRQCGSSIKPISVYAYALETGLYNYVGPCDDVPVLLEPSTGALWPNNATRTFTGRSSLENAIQRSLNTVAVDTCNTLGVNMVYQNMMRSGFTTLVENYTAANGAHFSDAALSPLSLGSFTFGVTVREMTQAYACFANGGVTSKARTYSVVRDAQGNVVLDNSQNPEALYSEDTAFMITRLLQTVISGSAGTARSYIDFHRKFDGLEVAAKTGTTNDNKDLYFCGYTPDLVGSCWYGYDNNKTITARGGAAAGLWNHAFRMVYEYYEEAGIPFQKQFKQPSTVAYAGDTGLRICTISGKLATEACEKDIGHYLGGGSVVTSNFYYTKSKTPTEYCDKHILVDWDRVTQSISVPGCSCPAENLVKVGFRLLDKEERCFERNVRISDASYIYINVPAGYVYPTSGSVPFFQNLYGEGEYPGYNGSSHNSVCTAHFGHSAASPGDTSGNE